MAFDPVNIFTLRINNQVILGRAFFEARRIKINPVDPTDVVCCDSGEKIDCEVVILRDGRGEIVTVT